MAKGTYERTPLVHARFQLTITERRIKGLHEKLAEAEREKVELQATIDELSGEAEHQHQLELARTEARHAELVQIRKEVESGKRRFAHDGELMLLLEEQKLAKELGLK